MGPMAWWADAGGPPSAGRVRWPDKLAYSSAGDPDLAWVIAGGYSVSPWIHGKEKVGGSIRQGAPRSSA